MNDQSIGDVLRAKREDRGLSFDEVHEATKITPENLAALEENRFDVFANKVYARAFLRDYANFLGLDSALLLARYEEEWAAPAAAQAVVRTERSAWRAVAWAVAVIVLVGAVGAGSYYYWWAGARESEPGLRLPISHRVRPTEKRVTVPPRVAPPAAHEPKPTAQPQVSAPPPAPRPISPAAKVTLEVTAIRGVWVRVKCDGEKVYEAIMPAGASRRFEAKQAINIRVGMAGAVRLIVNGVPQPPLGTLRVPGEKTFRRDGPASGAP